MIMWFFFLWTMNISPYFLWTKNIDGFWILSESDKTQDQSTSVIYLLSLYIYRSFQNPGKNLCICCHDENRSVVVFPFTIFVLKIKENESRIPQILRKYCVELSLPNH